VLRQCPGSDDALAQPAAARHQVQPGQPSSAGSALGHPADASHSAQEMAALRALLASANRETFNPAGLNIRDPAESAFLFLEVRVTRQTPKAAPPLTLAPPPPRRSSTTSPTARPHRASSPQRCRGPLPYPSHRSLCRINSAVCSPRRAMLGSCPAARY
jgi:hypothetical protein